MSDVERERVADELRRVREAVRERALLEPREPTLPPPLAVRTPQPMPPDPPAMTIPAAERPDNSELNARWRLDLPSAGKAGLVWRLLRRFLAPLVEAQQAFNSRQVQFDNELLSYVEARLDATHRHYDDVLGIHGRHMGEIDERHLILQEELVAHVHDLVKRIDLVLSESERGRLSQESAWRDLRTRLSRLEERLSRG